ncbi:hypothetical protein ACFT30_05290 [Microbacterium ureisolvens]|uniref:hypothetical protein n=1 Tax=Microbacterium ureisolvens TaxID=2781186 RepID=UPI00363CAA46
MAHIEVLYGSQTFTIVDRTIDDVQSHIDAVLATGTSGWISAFDGHGPRAPVRLLITAGVPIALTFVPSDEEL